LLRTYNGEVLLQQITLRNLLSFKGATIDLKPLNILIGENTAGKSNLIEAISLLQAAPSDFLNTIPRGGGVAYWLWMGGGVQAPSAGLSCLVKLSKQDLRYELEFSAEGGMLAIRREGLFDASGKAHFKRIKEFVDIGENLHGPAGTVQSVFALYKNPADPTPITLLAREGPRENPDLSGIPDRPACPQPTRRRHDGRRLSSRGWR
jgi:hypothetical protein